MQSLWRRRRKSFKESYLFEFSRLFSYPFTVLFYKLRFISPNFVTVLSFLIGVFSAFLLLNGNYVFAGIVYWFSWVFDLVDGELARLKGKASQFGAWLDGILDRIRELIILIAISVVIYINEPSLFVMVLSILAIISTLFWRHSALFTKVKFNVEDSKPKDQKPIEVDVAIQNLVISVLIIFNQLVVLLLLFAVLFNLAWIKNVLFWVIRYRKR
ncbi:MAG: CDP-alcohol phosphatidyltransferase family protein [Candidatus Woesearchaeota archaeon]